jgi:hypothetical protein
VKCVILQPSFLPWRGYFHQIYLADVFVFYDCVQYDKHGWRNRNLVKTSHGLQWLSIPVNATGTYAGLPINEITIANNARWRRKHLATIEQSYAGAPFWEFYTLLLDNIYTLDCHHLADLTCASTIAIARALGITHTRFLRSSELQVSGQKTDRLISILSQLGATHYISGPSAQDYIEADKFAAADINIEYMRYDYPDYPQLHGPFAGGVSILDLLFNVGPEAGRYIWSGEVWPSSSGELTQNDR